MYTIEDYLAIRKDEIMLFAATRMNLEGIKLSEVSLQEEDRHRVTLWNKEKGA